MPALSQRERTTALAQATGGIIPSLGLPTDAATASRPSAGPGSPRARRPASPALPPRPVLNHRTESSHRRSTAVDTAMMREADEKLGQFHEPQKNAPAKPKVGALTAGTTRQVGRARGKSRVRTSQG